MNNEATKKRIQSIKDRFLGRTFKKVLLTAALTGSSFSPMATGQCKESIPSPETENFVQEHQQMNLDARIERQIAELKKDIIENINKLQSQIKIETQKGRKPQFIRTILKDSYEKGGLPGSCNYCVAAATYALRQCEDDVLMQILPDPAQSAKEFHYSSHPNVSCPYWRDYCRQTMGHNYAEKGDQNFNELIASLETGDVLIVRSSHNTSTGEHCVIFKEKDENGAIIATGFNKEHTAEVPVSSIRSVSHIIGQYRENIREQMLERSGTLDLAQVPQFNQSSLIRTVAKPLGRS